MFVQASFSSPNSFSIHSSIIKRSHRTIFEYSDFFVLLKDFNFSYERKLEEKLFSRDNHVQYHSIDTCSLEKGLNFNTYMLIDHEIHFELLIVFLSSHVLNNP